MRPTQPPGPYRIRVERTLYSIVEIEASSPQEAERTARAMAEIETLEYTRQPDIIVKMLSLVPRPRRRS